MKVKLLSSLVVLLVSANSYAADQVAKYAKDAGVKSCLSAVSDIEQFFAKDKNYGSWALLAQDKPNNQPVNASLELTFSDGSQLIDFTVSPNNDGTCSYSYTRTWYRASNCMAVPREDFMAKAKYKTQLNQNITAFEDGDAKLLLMPAGNGCVVQKKEVGFRFKNFDS